MKSAWIRWLFAGVVALMIATAGTSTTHAEDSNRNDVRATLGANNWIVIYGDLINEADYALFVKAAAEAYASDNPGPVLAYFDQQVQVQVDKISKSLNSDPEVRAQIEDRLYEIILESFHKGGQNLHFERLQVSADIATYNRWERVVYDEPRTYRCKQRLPFGGWTWSVCTTVERVERKVPLPNNFQPYIRFRWDDSNLAAACVINNTNSTVNFQIKWGDRAWQSESVGAGYHQTFWWYPNSPNLYIQFSPSSRSSVVQYTLPRHVTIQNPPNCEDAERYQFVINSSGNLDLHLIN